MKRLFFFAVLCVAGINFLKAQDSPPALPSERNPTMNKVLCPYENSKINPTKNPRINPKVNWNINPYMTAALNPKMNALVNPKQNTRVNPKYNSAINPMISFTLNPLNGEGWKGHYVFYKDNNLQGYLVIAHEAVILAFDNSGVWTGYYVKTDVNSWNHFNLNDEWTGNFICFDSMLGYNFFNEAAEWTGTYAK